MPIDARVAARAPSFDPAAQGLLLAHYRYDPLPAGDPLGPGYPVTL